MRFSASGLRVLQIGLYLIGAELKACWQKNFEAGMERVGTNRADGVSIVKGRRAASVLAVLE